MTTTVEQPRAVRDDLATLAESLISEYEQVLPAVVVIRAMAREVQGQRIMGVPPAGLAAEVEPLVRLDLEDLVHLGRVGAS